MKKFTVFMLVIVAIRFVTTIFIGMQHNNPLGTYGYVLVPVFSPVYFCIMILYFVDLKRDQFMYYEIGMIHAFTVLFMIFDYYLYSIASA